MVTYVIEYGGKVCYNVNIKLPEPNPITDQENHKAVEN